MNEQQRQRQPSKADSSRYEHGDMNVDVAPSSSSYTSSPSKASTSDRLRATSPSPSLSSSSLSPSPTPAPPLALYSESAINMSTGVPPTISGAPLSRSASTTSRAQKRQSLVRRKPVPKLGLEEELALISASASASSLNLLGMGMGAGTASYVLLPAPLPTQSQAPSQMQETLHEEVTGPPRSSSLPQARAVAEPEASPRPSLTMSLESSSEGSERSEGRSRSTDSAESAAESSSSDEEGSSMPTTPLDGRSLSPSLPPKDVKTVNGEEVAAREAALAKLTGACPSSVPALDAEAEHEEEAQIVTIPASLSVPFSVTRSLPATPSTANTTFTPLGTPPAVPARNKKRLSAQMQAQAQLLGKEGKDLPPPPPVPMLPLSVTNSSASS
ncbi:hypothetical protein SCHPADRAFT_930877 [Schizopora paradoxa]|uniref:Uncharacterized protein n=1 Tax=Schizopora paradoxa TaxID=27342 RepID=A0A0H2RYM5_9AGAM|nr:hypothetical protein SCHPADRAFT_930877 [Schizopora paradoxa]